MDLGRQVYSLKDLWLTPCPLQMMKIDRYKERIDHMLFKIEFTEKLRHLSENMNAVLEASNALKESKALKELLNVCNIYNIF